MNEQLIVKNFGPIKDATVDFKKVTVFIGPTGGGKSTLAKLAAIVKQKNLLHIDSSDASTFLSDYGLSNFLHNRKSHIKWRDDKGLGFDISNSAGKKNDKSLNLNDILLDNYKENYHKYKVEIFDLINKFEKTSKKLKKNPSIASGMKSDIDSIIKLYIENKYRSVIFSSTPHYIPSERLFLSAIGESWAGIIRDDIGLPKILVNFANEYATSRKSTSILDIPFLKTTYTHKNGNDYIKIGNKNTLPLSEAASGIQSVAPLFVLINHISKQKEQPKSFIVEEPELNLYPTAQQGLMNWLVEKCTAGENDLTITTHSPYILASCNLLMEAYKVWKDRPELEAEIEKIVPRTSWINPEEFAAYYVADGTVRSIQDERTDLIGGNELDAVSGQISDAFRSLLRLKKQPA